jgi:hypothetical protein
MRFMHRSPVVALGALCLVACLSLLPATSGAFPIRWTDTGDTVPGDPDEPGSGTVVIRWNDFAIVFRTLPRIWMISSPILMSLSGAHAQSRGASAAHVSGS